VRASSLVLSAVAASLTALAPRDAWAGDRWQFQTGIDARYAWIRSMPSLSLHGPLDTSQRTLPSGAVLPSTGSQSFAALTWDAGATVNDRWMLPVFGLQYGWAVGGSPELVTAIDGSIVHVHPWSADFVTMLLPGFGVRQKVRRWMFEASVRPVVSLMETSASVASGADTTDLGKDHTLFSLTLGLRAELEVCRRTDPVQRVCLLASPALYEFGPMNGGTVGLRWEVGP
jgi:hypothetical protein